VIVASERGLQEIQHELFHELLCPSS
jgi:hypothetical protein